MDANPLLQLSNTVAGLAARAATSVVRVEGRRRGASSGVVWTADGVVVTAHHTLERDEDLRLGLASGESVPAELIGRDPTTDLALVRASAGGLVAVEWDDEIPRPGQLVLGISRPGAAARVVLASIARVAGELRAPGGGRIDRAVETTLALRPGVSGALVLGADGRGVGLAIAGIDRDAVVAVPPPTLRRVVKALLAHGEVRRGYLGLATIPISLPAHLRAATGEHVALLVSRVEPDSPAARAGILLGDALLSFGGETLQDPAELLTLLAEDRIGDAVAMKLLRAGEVRDVQVTIGARAGGVRR